MANGRSLSIALRIVLCLFCSGMAQTGSVLREYWSGIAGTSLAALKADPRFPSEPTGMSQPTSFESAQNWSDLYGTRLRGYVHPPTTGLYTFWISGDDNCELWLSTDESPAKKVLLAKVSGWTNYRDWNFATEQRSAQVSLTAGTKYFVEVLHKEGDGGDHVSVGWQLPDATYERPIPGNRLSPYPVQEDLTQWQHNASILLNTSSAGAAVTANVLDFPVLVRLTDADIDFAQARLNGADVRFAKANGAQLVYEIEQWDAVARTAAIWIKADTVYGNNSTQKIKMYWGNSAATSKSDPCAVFPSGNGFLGVWHLGEEQAGTGASSVYKDATTNGCNGIDYISSSTATGLIGRALAADGVSDYVQIPTFTDEALAGLTVSAWLKMGPQSVWCDIIDKEADDYSTAGFGLRRSPDDKFAFALHEGAKREIVSPTSFVEDGATWCYVTGTYDGGIQRLLVNGVQVNSQEYLDGPVTSSLNKLNIGRRSSAGDRYTRATIDEVRIERTARDANWTKLSYENQRPDQRFAQVEHSSSLNPPTNLSASVIGNQITLYWTDNSTTEVGFEILSGTSAGSLTLRSSVGTNVTTYIDIVSGCGSMTYYSVRAVGPSTSSSAAIIVDPVSIVPCVPSGITASVSAVGAITVTWSGNASGYILESKRGSGAWEQIYTGAISNFVHQGLECDVSYDYRVKAINTAGESGWSIIAAARTGYCPINPPSGLAADSSTPLEIRLAWNDNSSNEQGFRVFRKLLPDGVFSEVTALLANEVTYIDRIVTCAKRYAYYVVAHNANGASPASNTVEATTLFCGADKATSEMITIAGMLPGSASASVNGLRPFAIKLFDRAVGTVPIYEESFSEVPVKNGYFALTLGMQGDVATAIRAHTSLYYDVISDGQSVFGYKLQPLTAGAYSIANSFNLHGQGTPIGVVAAPVGASYVDTQNRQLYLKSGSTNVDWVKIGQ